ncbi:PAS domain-containing protein [Spirosoma rigui]|uniref:PAS domain-containing protein n=1 Tax=Spirosoma rigui TaxID=564064 RepID=UPI0009AF6B95|nr:PAS domain-containing protein [Spirosoma rigui]
MTDPIDSSVNDRALEIEQLQFALQAAGIGTWDYNLVTGQAKWSGICKELFGLPTDAVITAATLLEQVHPDDRAWVGKANMQAIDPLSDGRHDIVFRICLADKRIRWVQAKGKTFKNDQGQIIRFSGTAQDVTQTKLAQQQLETSQQRFRSLIEESPVATCLFMGPTHQIDIANTVMLGYWGKGHEVLGQPFAGSLPELNQQTFGTLLRQAFATGITHEEQSVPTRLNRHGESHLHYFDFTFKPLLHASGAVYAVLSMAIDVTERVEDQQRVDQIQRQVLTSFEQSPVGIAIVSSPDLTFRMVNPFYAELVGRPPGELVGQTLQDALPELRDKGFKELLEQVVTTGVPYIASEVAVDIHRRNGLETIYIDFTYQPWREGNETVGILVVVVDVTEQVRARQKVEASEAKLRSIIATAPAAMGLFVGRDLIVDMPNQAFIDIVGKGPDISGKPLREVMPELESQPFLQILDEVFTAGRMFQSFGSQVDIVQHGVMSHNFYNITYTPLRDESGAVFAILDIAIDVTAEVKTRQALEASEARFRQLSADLDSQVQLRTQELERANAVLAATIQDLQRSNHNLEQFAYVASHDLQEPLRKIQSFGDLLKNEYAEQLGTGINYLERMQVASGRMSTLIRDLLLYSRISTGRDTSPLIALDQVVRVVVNDLELLIDEAGAQLAIGPLPSVAGNSSQLEQLFQNLLSNALKFRRVGSPAYIRVQCEQVLAEHLPPFVKPIQPAMAYHRIDVIDNGIGFDEKYVDRIFQIFQRLHGKNEYAGTGIGLAICEKVVSNHGGAISASSKPGQGATFSIYLPG